MSTYPFGEGRGGAEGSGGTEGFRARLGIDGGVGDIDEAMLELTDPSAEYTLP